MPNNTPDVWTQIWALLTTHFASHNQLICGVVIAFLTSITKSFLYGKKDTPRRVIAEAVLCSILAGSAQPVLIHFNLGADWITPVGAALGLAGTSVIRQTILSIVRKRTGESGDEQV